jgi:WD40 repeat protein
MIALSADGGLVATAGADGTARLWAMKNGLELERLKNPGPVLAVAFSPDGEQLAAADAAGTCQLWDVGNGQLLRTLACGDNVARLALSQDAVLLAATTKRIVRIISVPDDREVARIDVDNDVAQIAFRPGDRFLTIAQRNGVARTVDVSIGHELTSASYNDPPVGAVALSPDGRFIAIAQDRGEVRIVSLEDGGEVTLPQSRQSLGTGPLGFSGNGKIFSVAGSDQSGAGSTGVVSSFAFEWEDRAVAHLYANGPLAALAFSADGNRLATVGADGTARVIGVTGGKELLSLPHAGVKYVSLSRDGSLVATAGEDKTTRVWSVRDSRELVRLTDEKPVLAISISSNGNLLSVNEGGTLQSVVVGGSGHVARETTNQQLSLSAFSPDGTRLAFLSPDGGGVMQVPDGKLSGKFSFTDPDDEEDLVSAMAVSPDGKFAAIGYQEGVVYLRRVQDSKDMARVTDKATTVAVAFSHDGRLLATAAKDGVVRIIGIPEGRELARIQHSRALTSVAFSSSGLLATADDVGTIRIWSTNFETVLQDLCKSNGRNLSRDEWTRSGYLNDLPWRPACENWFTPER